MGFCWTVSIYSDLQCFVWNKNKVSVTFFWENNQSDNLSLFDGPWAVPTPRHQSHLPLGPTANCKKLTPDVTSSFFRCEIVNNFLTKNTNVKFFLTIARNLKFLGIVLLNCSHNSTQYVLKYPYLRTYNFYAVLLYVHFN